MKTLATEPEARLTYLKRQLVKSVKKSRTSHENTCSYLPGEIIFLAGIKELIQEIKELAGGTSHAG